MKRAVALVVAAALAAPSTAAADGLGAFSYTLGTDGGGVALWGAGSFRKKYYLGGELAFAGATPVFSLLFVAGWRKQSKSRRWTFLADAGLGFTEDGGYDFYGERGFFHDGIIPSGAFRIHGLVRLLRAEDGPEIHFGLTADARTTFDGDHQGAAIGAQLVFWNRGSSAKKRR